MNQEKFESKYLNKIVKPKGVFYKIPIKEYRVTSALYNFYGDETIFAIMALDYTLENKHWFTIRIKEEDLEESLGDFEIIN